MTPDSEPPVAPATGEPTGSPTAAPPEGRPLRALGCVGLALLAVLLPLGVALALVIDRLAPDGDRVRDLGPEAIEIRLDSPDSAISSTTVRAGREEPLVFGIDLSGPKGLWIRFPIELPTGSKIVAADIVLRCEDNLDAAGRERIEAVINLVDTGDQPPFSNARFRDATDLQALPLDSRHAVRWQVDPWEAKESYATPDLAPLVQRFIDREGYRPRTYIAFCIHGVGQARRHTTDRRQMRSVSSLGTGQAPVLRITLAASEEE